MNKMQKTILLVCAHKPDRCLATPPYMPVQAGRAIARVKLPFAGDDTGDNISARNPNFCELTVHYWAWKNLRDYDYIGLNHYRRYFDFETRSPANLRTERTEKFFGREHPVPDMEELFSRCDVVMARPKPYPYNLYTEYSHAHIAGHLAVLRQIVSEKYPDYTEAYDRILLHNNRLSHYNMFIMPRERFEHYSAWLFDILFEAERRIEIPRDPVQARIFGYMSERLLMVYVLRNRLKTCYRQVIMVDDRKRKGLGKYLFHAAVNNLLYRITRPFRRRRF